MSNTIRYDSLLVRDLAAELLAKLGGQRVHGLRFDRENQTISIGFEQGALQWSPAAGPALTTSDIGSAGSALVLPRKPQLDRVAALRDERVLRIGIAGGPRDNAVCALMVELLPTRPNVIALDCADRVLKLLTPGNTGRTRGQPYAAPPKKQRAGADGPLSIEAFLELLNDLPYDERRARLLARIAYTSAINASAILGDPSAELALPAAHARYIELITGPVQPCIVSISGLAQAYGHPLWQQAPRYSTLLDAFAATGDGAPTVDAVRRLENAIEYERRKRARMLAEQSSAAQDAQQLREDANLLLTRAQAVPRGAQHVELEDFAGGAHSLELDPALSALDNAQMWYAAARRRERAALRMPALIQSADRTIEELEQRLQRARSGETVELPRQPVRTRSTREEKLPYRRYRTSSGLEVRVGRNSRDNDALTFHHAAADDIWLHARDVGGAHVVLRWADPNANPPGRDLEQAAALAALHSRARHSGVVPVDWTRRKYVRKPRQAAPGSVRVERVKTIFVMAEPQQLESLRWPD